MSERQHINDIIKEMSEYEIAYERAVKERTIRESAYRLAFATEELKAEGTIPECKNQAILATQKQYVDWQEAKASATILKQKLEDGNSSLWALRELVKAENQAFVSHGQFQT